MQTVPYDSVNGLTPDMFEYDVPPYSGPDDLLVDPSWDMLPPAQQHVQRHLPPRQQQGFLQAPRQPPPHNQHPQQLVRQRHPDLVLQPSPHQQQQQYFHPHQQPQYADQQQQRRYAAHSLQGGPSHVPQPTAAVHHPVPLPRRSTSGSTGHLFQGGPRVESEHVQYQERRASVQAPQAIMIKRDLSEAGSVSELVRVPDRPPPAAPSQSLQQGPKFVAEAPETLAVEAGAGGKKAATGIRVGAASTAARRSRTRQREVDMVRLMERELAAKKAEHEAVLEHNKLLKTKLQMLETLLPLKEGAIEVLQVATELDQGQANPSASSFSHPNSETGANDALQQHSHNSDGHAQPSPSESHESQGSAAMSDAAGNVFTSNASFSSRSRQVSGAAAAGTGAGGDGKPPINHPNQDLSRRSSLGTTLSGGRTSSGGAGSGAGRNYPQFLRSPEALQKVRTLSVDSFRQFYRNMIQDMCMLLVPAEVHGLNSTTSHAAQQLAQFVPQVLQYINTVRLLNQNLFMSLLDKNLMTGAEDQATPDFWDAVVAGLHLTPVQLEEIAAAEKAHMSKRWQVEQNRARIAGQLVPELVPTKSTTGERLKLGDPSRPTQSQQPAASVGHSCPQQQQGGAMDQHQDGLDGESEPPVGGPHWWTFIENLTQAMKRNLLEEQDEAWNLGEFISSTILTPTQVAKIYASSYPFLPSDAFAIVPALTRLAKAAKEKAAAAAVAAQQQAQAQQDKDAAMEN